MFEKILIRGSILFVSLIATIDNQAQPEQKNSALYWESAIKEFEQIDSILMPPEDAVLFVGSSSIVYWKTLARDMAPLTVINRGFGGSQMSDLNYYRERIVLKYKPRLIVVYEGDNDIGLGSKVDSVLNEFDDFTAFVMKKLPESIVCFIAVKPSVLRKNHWPNMQRVNAGLAERARKNTRICYIDIATPMLLNDGSVNPDLFVSDGLHLNELGYTVWADVVKPVLMANSPE